MKTEPTTIRDREIVYALPRYAYALDLHIQWCYSEEHEDEPRLDLTIRIREEAPLNEVKTLIFKGVGNVEFSKPLAFRPGLAGMVVRDIGARQYEHWRFEVTDEEHEGLHFYATSFEIK